MQNLPIVSYDKPICLVGGARISPRAFQAALGHTTALIAVDSGADFLIAQRKIPDIVIGDLDSLSDTARATFADRLRHIPEQSTTDFEKALTRIDAPCLVALGFTGGRIDHLLSVLNVMRRFPHRPVVLLDQDDASFMARAGDTLFHLEKGTRVSVMPVGQAAGVSLEGVRWSFTDKTMTLDGFTSPSNAALGGEIRLSTGAPCLVTLPRAQLAVALQAAVHG